MPKFTAASQNSVCDGLDLATLVAPFWKALMEHPEAKAKVPGLPKVKFTGTRRDADSYSGMAYGDRHEVVIRLGANCDKVEGMELLLHELAHLACYFPEEETLRFNLRKAAAMVPYNFAKVREAKQALTSFRKENAHGLRFRRILVDTAVKLWGKEVRVSIHVPGRCYQLDDHLMAAMRKTMGLPWKRGSWIKDQPPACEVEKVVERVEMVLPKPLTATEVRALPVGSKVTVYYTAGGTGFEYQRTSEGFVAGSSSFTVSMLLDIAHEIRG